MRKVLLLCVVVSLSVSMLLSGCGSSGTNASDKAVSVAQQAIDIVDKYLDGNATYNTVSNKLDELYDEMDYVSDMPTDTSDEIKQHSADLSISTDLVMLSSYVMKDYYNGTNETYDKIVEKRNDIAKTAGLEKR